ncbi:MAG: hypothetical protein RLY97_708 [Pseudomonadota bacterium]
MTRSFLSFPCEGNNLQATLDIADGTTGLLIVSGGNELRSGAWAGQSQLAARIAAAGYPVLRFDRRGVGDSDGPNAEFRASAPDIAAALTAFRAAMPHLTRIAAWGNCDAASALMLSAGAGCDALILSNPWTIEQDDTLETGAEEPAKPDMPVGALRAHYIQRLTNPAALKRLFSGQVSLSGLFSSVFKLLRPPPPPGSLAQDMAKGLAQFSGPVAILIAERDRTAQAFLGAWPKADPRIHHCPPASHSFVEQEARQWLEAQILTVLKGQ